MNSVELQKPHWLGGMFIFNQIRTLGTGNTMDKNWPQQPLVMYFSHCLSRLYLQPHTQILQNNEDISRGYVKTIQLIRPLIVTEAFLKTGGVFPPPPPQEVYPSDSLRSGFSFELKNTAAKQNNKSKKNIRPVTRQHPYLTAAPPPRSLLPLFPSRECEGGICLSWGEREISTGELMGRVQELGELSPCCMQP